MDFIKELNDKQYEAVSTSYQYVRVVAGAGSGKTRVLTYRIAYLLSEMDVLPWKILAITFTNKVANEMKTRVLKMVPDATKDLTIRTFHSFAANFLRREISVLNYPSSFTILDEEDQTKMIKDIAFDMGYKRGDKIVGKAINYIGSQKLKEKYPDDITIEHERFEDEKVCLEIYTRYEEEKNKALSLDFDDLLLKTNYILEHYIDIRMRWQDRIDHILVDEFQDTNNTEFKLLRYLMKPSTCLYVVGDPDQTIYTWRGANQDIILKMQETFGDVETIILDRNYRSTQAILDSANKLIANNKMRVAKNLYTENNKGEPIVVKQNASSKSEADYVAREIVQLKNGGKFNYSDIVILYRSSYVTVDFEAALMARNIPYKIYGGLKFYQRREIKDVLSYFHLITNTKDNISFERIVNVPKRGIGETTVNIIKDEAKEADMPLYEYLRVVDEKETNIPKKAVNSLKSLIMRIDQAREDIAKDEETFSKILENLIIDIGYQEVLLLEDDGEERIENVRALFEDIRHYLKSNPESTFEEYLQNVTLLSAQDEVVDGDFVTLMTVHTAKGLEYPVVFVIRLNEGVFPNQRALADSGFKGLEEERRLAYVAMTRAKQKLYMTYAGDYSFVLQGNLIPSQFIKEAGLTVAPSGFATSYNPYRSEKKPREFHFDDGKPMDFTPDEPIRQNFNQATNDVDSWAVGDIVIHKKLGRGVVIALEGDDIIKVRFDEHGDKSILGNHPSVSKGGHSA